MSVLRYEPWILMNRMQRDFDRLLQQNAPVSDEQQSITDWVPAVDIREEDTQFVLHADLPGIEPNDIEVTLEKGVLTVRGKRVLATRDAYPPPSLPEHLIVVGSGVTGVEFVHMFSAFGCEVTLVVSRQQVLPLKDPEVAAALEDDFIRRGVRLLKGARAIGVENDGDPDQRKAERSADLTDLERIGHSARLNHDVVEVISAFPQCGDSLSQSVGQRAARTPVCQRDGLTIPCLDEVGVDVDVAEIVDQGSNPHAAVIAQQMVQHGGLASAQIASDDRQGQAHSGSFR